MSSFTNAIIDFVFKNFPGIGIFIVVVLCAWYVSALYHNLKHRFENVESEIESLPCERHKEQINDHSSMKSTLDSINEQVAQISKWILRFDNSVDTVSALVRKCSPRRMTAFGISLFKASGADVVVSDNEDFFLDEVEKRNPDTPYDVEQASLDVVFTNLGNAIFNGIKNYIYYQPEKVELEGEDGIKKEVQISLMAIAQLMSLDIRDRYLARHPDITQPAEGESVGEESHKQQ